MICKNCGKEVDNKALICIHCGCATGGVGVNKEWLITLLCCLFLGVFGVHRFLNGYKTSAIIMVVLTVTGVGAAISWIWAIFDLVIIILDEFKTADGRVIKREL